MSINSSFSLPVKTVIHFSVMPLRDTALIPSNRWTANMPECHYTISWSSKLSFEAKLKIEIELWWLSMFSNWSGWIMLIRFWYITDYSEDKPFLCNLESSVIAVQRPINRYFTSWITHCLTRDFFLFQSVYMTLLKYILGNLFFFPELCSYLNCRPEWNSSPRRHSNCRGTLTIMEKLSGFKNGPTHSHFSGEFVKFQTGILGGLWRLGEEELWGLPVCLPPTEPVPWFLHDQALYLDCAHIAFCSRAPGGQPTGHQWHRDSFHWQFALHLWKLYARPSTSTSFLILAESLHRCSRHWEPRREIRIRTACMRNVEALKRADDHVLRCIKTHR